MREKVARLSEICWILEFSSKNGKILVWFISPGSNGRILLAHSRFWIWAFSFLSADAFVLSSSSYPYEARGLQVSMGIRLERVDYSLLRKANFLQSSDATLFSNISKNVPFLYIQKDKYLRTFRWTFEIFFKFLRNVRNMKSFVFEQRISTIRTIIESLYRAISTILRCKVVILYDRFLFIEKSWFR